MDIPGAIAKIIVAAIWAGVVVYVIWNFQTGIATILEKIANHISRIRKAKFPGGGFEFDIPKFPPPIPSIGETELPPSAPEENKAPSPEPEEGAPGPRTYNP